MIYEIPGIPTKSYSGRSQRKGRKRNWACKINQIYWTNLMRYYLKFVKKMFYVLQALGDFSRFVSLKTLSFWCYDEKIHQINENKYIKEALNKWYSKNSTIDKLIGVYSISSLFHYVIKYRERMAAPSEKTYTSSSAFHFKFVQIFCEFVCTISTQWLFRPYNQRAISKQIPLLQLHDSLKLLFGLRFFFNKYFICSLFHHVTFLYVSIRSKRFVP